MKARNTTETQDSLAALGKTNRQVVLPEKHFEAFVSWEMLQRGIVHNKKSVSPKEIGYLCGASGSFVNKIISNTPNTSV